MSALNVCLGTLPSEYHSVLAISAPPSLPAISTRIPRAPILIAFWTALFIALLNDTLLSICCAILSATSAASISGFLTSTIFKCNSLFVNFATLFFRVSISAPFFPIITPGLAAYMVTLHFLCGLSIITLLIPDCAQFFLINFLISKSSWSKSPYSFVLENHLLSQVLFTWSRRPTGLIFCPIMLSPFLHYLPKSAWPLWLIDWRVLRFCHSGLWLLVYPFSKLGFFQHMLH